MTSWRVAFVLTILVAAGSTRKHHRREIQTGTHYTVGNGSSPLQCPPPHGIIRIHSHTENIASLHGNEGGLTNLLFMCGTTQLPYQAPSRWVMREGPNGSQVNVTIYEKKYKMVPLCCPGYTRNSEDVCVPKCKGNCSNGLCVAPNQCVCYEGYALNNLGECVITCPCGCPNGGCRGNTCVCNHGHALDSKGVCNPICVNECENGDCTSPNQCTCHDGYKKKKNQDTHVCFPYCTVSCKNGKCVAPDVCECNEGYHRERNTGRCVPTCSGCDHGDCVAPYTCHCHKGYRRQNEDCAPVCDGGCFNATCTSPNKCTCFKGYKNTTPNICRPKCFPSCINGDCVSPNHCECYSGYIKEAGHLNRHKCVSIVNTTVNGISNIVNAIRNRRSSNI